MVGQTISHYRIIEEISRGGMGIVYRATDLSLNREVAVKILPADLVADPDRRARFIQEAQAASALEHPHIAVIHEVGESGGVYFIAMELIRGEKLSDVLARGPLKLDRALDLASEIAEALGRAHEKGVVHRDLKPANVMLTEYGHAKIIDFGLAKLVEAVPSDLSGETGALAQTDPGVMLGTVAYMAPEQARGQKIDHRADIFAFGILLYEMVAGHPPFRAQSGLDTLHAILNAAPPPLPPLMSDAAPDVERIVEKCLEKDPDARYQGMKDLVVDLRAARRRSEVSSAHSRTAVAVPRGRSLPRLAIGGGVLAVALIAAAIVWFRKSPSPAPPRASSKPSVAVMYFENNTGNPSLDWLRTGLTDMLVTDLSQSPNIEVLGTDRLYQILTELRRQDDRQISFDVVQQVANRAGIENVLLGSYVKAGDVIRINLKLQEAKTGRIISSERVDAAGESNLLSMVDDLTRRVKERFDVRPAVSGSTLLTKPTDSIAPAMMIDRELKEVTTNSIEAYRFYVEGVDLHNQIKEEQAAPLFERAIAIDPGFAMAYAKLAVIHGNLGHPVETTKYSKLALEHAERLTPRERFYIEGVHYSRSWRDAPRAIAAYQQALRFWPEHVSSRNNIALVYHNLERYADALEHYSDAARRRTPFASNYGGLSSTYFAMGDVAKSLQVVDDYARAHPDSGTGAFMMAIANVRAGNLDVAAAAAERARSLGVIDWRANLAALQVAIGRDDWAGAEAAGRAMGGSRDSFSRWLGNRVLALAALYRGRSADALKLRELGAAVAGPKNVLSGGIRTEAALLLLARGDVKAALAEAARAVTDATGNREEALALRAQALAADAAGSRAEADRALARIQKLGEDPLFEIHRRDALLTEGELALQRGQAKASIALLTKAASMLAPRGFLPNIPMHVPIWYALGSAQLATGDDAQARESFERILDRLPERTPYPIEYVRSHYFLARLAAKRGDHAKAKEYFGRFAALWKDSDLDRDRVREAQEAVGGRQ